MAKSAPTECPKIHANVLLGLKPQQPNFFHGAKLQRAGDLAKSDQSQILLHGQFFDNLNSQYLLPSISPVAVSICIFLAFSQAQQASPLAKCQRIQGKLPCFFTSVPPFLLSPTLDAKAGAFILFLKVACSGHILLNLRRSAPPNVEVELFNGF